MSSRHLGRGRGGRNPLATPFRAPAPHQTPESPNDTNMDDDPASPVQTVPAPESFTTSTRDSSCPLPSRPPIPISRGMENTNLGTHTRLVNLENAFQAMQDHLMVVQERHIEDVEDLEGQVATLTSQVSSLKEQLLQYQTTTPAQRAPLPAPPQQQTWAQKAARAVPVKPPTSSPNKESTSSVLTKRDRTIVIERDGSTLPDDTNPLTIHDALNTAIKKPLIATIEFTTNHHVLLHTKDNTPATTVLKNHRSVIEETTRTIIPAAIGLRKDEIWHNIILHSIPTNTTFTTVQSEIEEFNPGIYLPRPLRCLTTEAQHQNK